MVTLTLVNSGSWELDAPVSRYFTDKDVVEDPRSKRLTTGTYSPTRPGSLIGVVNFPGEKLAFQFEASTKHQYSGEGFEYLRHALENKFKRSLSKLADSIIFKHLGMSSIGFIWKPADDMRFAYLFDAAGKQLDVVKNYEPNAADLLKTTAGDYCKFMAWILSGAGFRKGLLDEMISHQVERKAKSYMGLGWVVYDPVAGEQCAISHGGHDPGVHTIAIILPKSNKALLIFTQF